MLDLIGDVKRLGGKLGQPCVDERAGRFLVPCSGAGILTLEADTGREVNQLALPERWAEHIACCSTTQRAFVCSTWSGHVYMLDTLTGTKLDAIDVKRRLYVLGTAVIEASQRVVIGTRHDQNTSEVVIVDARDGSVCGACMVGREPKSYVVDERRDCIYIGAHHDPLITVVAGKDAALIGTIPLEGIMIEGVIDPVEDVLFVLMKTKLAVVSLATRTVVEQQSIDGLYSQIGAPVGPPRWWQTGIDTQQQRLFLVKPLDNGAAILMMLDARSLRPIRWQRVGYMPMDLLIDEECREVYVIDSNTKPPDFSPRLRGTSGIRILDSLTGKKKQFVEAGDRLAGAQISRQHGTLVAVDWFDKVFVYRTRGMSVP